MNRDWASATGPRSVIGGMGRGARKFYCHPDLLHTHTTPPIRFPLAPSSAHALPLRRNVFLNATLPADLRSSTPQKYPVDPHHNHHGGHAAMCVEPGGSIRSPVAVPRILHMVPLNHYQTSTGASSGGRGALVPCLCLLHRTSQAHLHRRPSSSEVEQRRGAAEFIA